MSFEGLHPHIEYFSELLKERFSKRIHTTEDTVRYTFFYALTSKMEISPNEIFLEYPHPVINGAEIDTYIPKRSTFPPTAYEFKFHRRIPSKKNSPKPMKAGLVFKDIFRLALLQEKEPETDCFLIYVTDDEMLEYFRKKNNKLIEFFDQGPEDAIIIDLAYVADKSDTFCKAAGDVVPCQVRAILKNDISSDYAIRIYRILPVDYPN